MGGLAYVQKYSPHLFQLLHSICYKEWNQDVHCEEKKCTHGDKLSTFVHDILGTDANIHPQESLPLILEHVDYVAVDAMEHLYSMSFLSMENMDRFKSVEKSELLNVFKNWCYKLASLVDKYSISRQRPLLLYNSLCEFDALHTFSRIGENFVDYCKKKPHYKEYIEDARYVGSKKDELRYQCNVIFSIREEKYATLKSVTILETKKSITGEFKYGGIRVEGKDQVGLFYDATAVESQRLGTDEYVVSWVSDRKVPEFFGAPCDDKELLELVQIIRLGKKDPPDTTYGLLKLYVENLEAVLKSINEPYGPMLTQTLDAYVLQKLAELHDYEDEEDEEDEEDGAECRWLYKLASVMSMLELLVEYSDSISKSPNSDFCLGGKESLLSQRDRTIGRVTLIMGQEEEADEEYEADIQTVKFLYLRDFILHTRLISMMLGRYLEDSDPSWGPSPVWKAFRSIVKQIPCLRGVVEFPSKGSDPAFVHAVETYTNKGKVLLCVSSIAPRVLYAHASTEPTSEAAPMFLETSHHILDFHGMRSRDEDIQVNYSMVLESTLWPRGGRELFGQFATPNDDNKEALGLKEDEMADADQSFSLRLKEAYDGPLYSNAFKKSKQNAASNFVYLRMCAPEKTVLSNYEQAKQHLLNEKGWNKGKQAKGHFENAMKLLGMFEWHRTQLGEERRNMVLLYGIVLLEWNVLEYLNVYPWETKM